MWFLGHFAVYLDAKQFGVETTRLSDPWGGTP